jgi:two-component system sensor histidine kinase LytS
MRVLVPPLIVQPLVENAVKHGIAPLPEGGSVRIVARFTAERGAEALEISVSDSGGAFPAGREPGTSQGLGVGLENVRKRLRLNYGEGTKIQVNSGHGQTCVWFRVPIENGPVEQKELLAR